MKKPIYTLLSLTLCLSLLSGCGLLTIVDQETDIAGESRLLETTESSAETTEASKRDIIPFEEGQYYAVAHLGYQEIVDWEQYVQKYLDSTEVPTHYISGGDYYLIIPRYDGMALTLLKNDMETMESHVIYEEANCRPFIVQCNISDIFPDVTIQLHYEGKTAEFSPFISLKDGSLDTGTRGLDITQSPE